MESQLINAAKDAVTAIRKLDAFDDYVVVRSNLELAIYAAERRAFDANEQTGEHNTCNRRLNVIQRQ